jgi:hypothetical protein
MTSQAASFNIEFPIRGLIFGDGARPDTPVDEVSLEVISDASGLQVNVLNQGTMQTRLQIGIDEKGQVVCKTWDPRNWSKNEPDKVDVLCSVNPNDGQAENSAKGERDEDY